MFPPDVPRGEISITAPCCGDGGGSVPRKLERD